MARTLIVCALLTTLPLAARAADRADDTQTVIRLNVSPMAAPKPALKYHLLPTLDELNPGNPVHDYIKCFMEQNNFFFAKDSVAKREKWSKMPLKDLPVKEMRKAGYGGGHPLRLADEA